MDGSILGWHVNFNDGCNDGRIVVHSVGLRDGDRDNGKKSSFSILDCGYDDGVIGAPASVDTIGIGDGYAVGIEYGCIVGAIDGCLDGSLLG